MPEQHQDRATLVVAGQGYVGLPLAVRAVEMGWNVIGVEPDPLRAKRLQAVGHIASVDVGVFPALHNLSHDSDLPTKFYEYAQARLPMVVSDVRTTAETTRMLGQGEVFKAGDVDDYLRAVRAVLSDLSRYRKAYDEHPDLLAEWMWEPQADVLDAVYTRLSETS